MPADNDWPMRTAIWDKPEKEIPMFNDIAAEKGYAWVGCKSTASHCDSVLVFKKGSSKRAHGIIQVTDCRDRDEIDDDDYHFHRPQSGEIPYGLDEEKLLNPRWTRFYKMTSGMKVFIERWEILGDDHKPVRGSGIYANTRVSLRETAQNRSILIE